MTALYSYQGQEPQKLPERIRLNNGTTRTDSSTFTEDELVSAGFTGPYEKPDFNPEIETLIWNEETKSWSVDFIPDDLLWKAVRNERNFLLSVSDWTQLPDASLTTAKKTAWATYRQALRDLPKNNLSPKEITWPLQPE